jgi:hypothetical protein
MFLRTLTSGKHFHSIQCESYYSKGHPLKNKHVGENKDECKINFIDNNGENVILRIS